MKPRDWYGRVVLGVAHVSKSTIESCCDNNSPTKMSILHVLPLMQVRCCESGLGPTKSNSPTVTSKSCVSTHGSTREVPGDVAKLEHQQSRYLPPAAVIAMLPKVTTGSLCV
jgi:hypothetical protein